MKTLNSYLNSGSGHTLTLDEMIQLYDAMVLSIDQCESEYKKDLLDDMLKAACYYANFRAEWEFMERKQKITADKSRTMAHDSFIRALDILVRLIRNSDGDVSWFELLGDNRKRIGDFACFIAFIIEINNR